MNVMVLVAATLVRLIYLHQVRGAALFEIPVLDAATYERLAREIWTESGSLSGRAYFRPPFYPLVLGLVQAWVGSSATAVTLVQMAFGVATAGFAAGTARRLRGEGAALIAGLLTGLAPVLPFFEGQRLITSLYTLLVTVLLWVAVRGSGLRGRMALGGGLVLGLASITRPNALIFLPLLLILGAAGRPRWRGILLILLGMSLPLGAVLGRNLVVGGDWVLVSANGGVNFYIGNNPQSDGMSAVPPGAAWEPYVTTPSREAGRLLSPSEVSRYWIRRTLGECAAAPLATVQLTLRKIAAFFTAVEVPNNLAYSHFAHEPGPAIALLRAPLPSFAWLTPLSFLGLVVVALERRRGQWVLAAGLLLHVLAVVPFFVCARFRTPALPLLAVLAAVGLCGWGALHSPARRLLAVAALAFGIWLGPLNAARAPHRLEPGRSHYWTAVAELGRAARSADPQIATAARQTAWRSTEAGLLEAPDHPDLILLRAQQQDDARSALADLDAALERQPEFVLARLERAERWRRQGAHARALADYRAALRVEPFHPGALAAAAALALRLEDAPAARDWSRRLTQSYPQSTAGWYLLGESQTALADAAAAEQAYKQALRLDPADARAARALAQLHERSEQTAVNESGGPSTSPRDSIPSPRSTPEGEPAP